MKTINLRDSETVLRIREVLEGLKSGDLGPVACLMVINMYVNPPEITQDDMEWASKIIKLRGIPNN